MRLARSYAILVAVLAILEGGGMNTRKQFLRDGFGLAAILSTQTAPAILVRSMAAARNGIAAAKRGWVNPYVTDGLVAMWDGEWNVKGGVHDADATTIADLSGNGHDLSFSGTYGIGPDHFSIDGTGGAYGYVDGLEFGSPMTQDMCVEINSRHAFARFVADNCGLCCRGGTDRAVIGRLYCFNRDVDFPNSSREPGFNRPFWQGLTVGDSVATFYHRQFAPESVSCPDSRHAGRTYVFNRADGTRGITGKVYGIRIYSRVLTADELARNRSVDRRRFGSL